MWRRPSRQLEVEHIRPKSEGPISFRFSHSSWRGFLCFSPWLSEQDVLCPMLGTSFQSALLLERQSSSFFVLRNCNPVQGGRSTSCDFDALWWRGGRRGRRNRDGPVRPRTRFGTRATCLAAKKQSLPVGLPTVFSHWASVVSAPRTGDTSASGPKSPSRSASR